MTSRVTGSAAETEALGEGLAGTLSAGDIVLVSGELGAGKTTFVRGAARALGVREAVTSPTFTIGQRYPAGAGVAYVCHLDLYRVSSLVHEDPDLLADYVGADVITFVEWPAVGEHELAQLGPLKHRVMLRHGGGDQRIVEIG